MSDYFRRDMTYDEAPQGSKNEDWIPIETEAYIIAAIDRIRTEHGMSNETITTTLRGDIAMRFYAAGMTMDAADKAASAVLQRLRDELTSDATINAVRSETARRPVIDAMVFGVAFQPTERDIITAAIDAVMGEDR